MCQNRNKIILGGGVNKGDVSRLTIRNKYISGSKEWKFSSRSIKSDGCASIECREKL